MVWVDKVSMWMRANGASSGQKLDVVTWGMPRAFWNWPEKKWEHRGGAQSWTKTKEIYGETSSYGEQGGTRAVINVHGRHRGQQVNPKHTN